jgi:hypothetical protein
LTDFPKILKYKNSIELRPVGTEFIHADGQPPRRTERHDKANSRFSQFCEHAYKKNDRTGIQNARQQQSSSNKGSLNNTTTKKQRL